MHLLMRQVQLLTEAWNQTCPHQTVPAEWTEEYVLADAALKYCFTSMTPTRAEVLYIEERRQEFRRRLEHALPLLQDLASLVDALP